MRQVAFFSTLQHQADSKDDILLNDTPAAKATHNWQPSLQSAVKASPEAAVPVTASPPTGGIRDESTAPFAGF
ncbi:hypothetical protein WKI13_20355 [Teredinibacter turnerae]|uniref:hypothetical protein n=1 Tax=Teredinibacter turnerae TaxID=2426 RepID=UPI00037FA86F|nr:hypothetical protein [Teredinibacter turnerae]